MVRLWRKPESVEYEPISVKELLTEMKDISELIVDLAYSAIIFDSKDIAEEVRTLEMQMDKYLYQIRMNALLASRNVEDAEALSGLLQVAAASENISNAAGDIIGLLDIKLEDRPYIPSFLQNADEKIKSLRIPNDSPVLDRSLGELNLESKTGTRVIALRRRKKWLYDPDDTMVLRGGDILIVRGVEDGYRQLKKRVGV